MQLSVAPIRATAYPLPVMPVPAVDERDAAPLQILDRVDISAEARRAADGERHAEADATRVHDGARIEGTKAPGRRQLSNAEQKEVRELQQRDREVRTHEQAHKAAAGDLAVGGPTYEYQSGPDGKRYAVGGHVDIQLREAADPQKTLEIAQRAQRAANAPQEPSAQDRKVAAMAAAMAAEARREIATERDGDRPTEPRLGRGILV